MPQTTEAWTLIHTYIHTYIRISQGSATDDISMEANSHISHLQRENELLKTQNQALRQQMIQDADGHRLKSIGMDSESGSVETLREAQAKIAEADLKVADMQLQLEENGKVNAELQRRLSDLKGLANRLKELTGKQQVPAFAFVCVCVCDCEIVCVCVCVVYVNAELQRRLSDLKGLANRLKELTGKQQVRGFVCVCVCVRDCVFVCVVCVCACVYVNSATHDERQCAKDEKAFAYKQYIYIYIYIYIYTHTHTQDEIHSHVKSATHKVYIHTHT